MKYRVLRKTEGFDKPVPMTREPFDTRAQAENWQRKYGRRDDMIVEVA